MRERVRRNLTPFQRAELALRLKPIVKAKAKERQESTHLVGPGIQKKNMVVLKSAQPSKSRDELAAIAGISHDTLKRAEVPSNLRPAAIAHLIG